MDQAEVVEWVDGVRAAERESQGRWLVFLSRWSLVAAVVELALLGLAVVWFLPASEAGPLTAEHGELAAALSDPGLYRMLAVLDVAVWVALGGLFVGLAAVFARRAPIRAALLAACGVGQLLGVAGAFMRLEVVGGVVSRHGDAAASDAQVLDWFVGLQDVVFSLFNAGALLWAVAFVLAASVGWRAVEVPRWLAGAFGVLGVVAVVDVGLYLITGGFVLDLVKFALLPVVLIASAAGFRRRRVDAAV